MEFVFVVVVEVVVVVEGVVKGIFVVVMLGTAEVDVVVVFVDIAWCLVLVKCLLATSIVLVVVVSVLVSVVVAVVVVVVVVVVV